MVDEGKFRSDLYYRLHGISVDGSSAVRTKRRYPLPIRCFTRKHARRMNRPVDSIPSAAIEAARRPRGVFH
jgi:formate hydrogenlyase transcriptional activator